MSKIVLDDTAGGYNIVKINSNFQKIEDELNNKVLYRDNPDGEANAMSDDLDMNSHRIYNLPEPVSPSEAARLQDVQNAISGVSSANLISFTPVATVVATTVQAAIAEVVTDYQAADLVHPADTIDAHNATAIRFDSATGIVRTVASKLSDTVNVKDYGAVGDGTTDDTVAIQNATNTGKVVFFPKPTSFYKTTAAINMGNSSRWLGEHGPSTIVRRTNGPGSVLDYAGSNQNCVIENITIGGIGTVGITVAGGGYANYLSTLSLRNVHFEADQLTNINANLIHCNFTDCTFGYFSQTSVNANLQHIISSFSGGNNTNVNVLTNCKFFNAATTLASVSFTAGLILNFINCVWENNGRDLFTSNVQNCLLLNCYTERGKHATSQFEFGASRTRTKVVGGQFSGGSMPAAAAMFRGQTGGAIFVEDADIVTTASAFAYKNISTGLNTLPVSGEHHFKNCRIQGNASDPLLWMDNIIEGGVVAWTPSPTSLTVVNGTGGATYSGTWSIRNRVVNLTIRIATTGTCTTASTAGVSYFQLPTNIPVPQVTCIGGGVNEVSGASMGDGMAYINGRFYLPAWAAQSGNISFSVTYFI